MKQYNSETFVKLVGKQIKKLRKKQDMTQLDLSIKSDMEENALQRIETGRTNPTLKTLLKIVNALGIDFKELFEFSDEL
ncbi:SOS-response repressor and protease LexA [Tenacibaculum sp. 190524A02b]|uniref:helix-turn-helix domain-containing protein n=1 Tax=Tenacibaculum vairaonense TaxID=3137860 RepID=UPI0032B1D43E